MLRGNHHPIVFFPRLWLLHNHPSPNRPWTCRSHRLHQRCPCWKQNWALFGKQGVTQLLFLLLLVGCWLLLMLVVGCCWCWLLFVVCLVVGLSLSLSSTINSCPCCREARNTQRSIFSWNQTSDPVPTSIVPATREEQWKFRKLGMLVVDCCWLTAPERNWLGESLFRKGCTPGSEWRWWQWRLRKRDPFGRAMHHQWSKGSLPAMKNNNVRQQTKTNTSLENLPKLGFCQEKNAIININIRKKNKKMTNSYYVQENPQMPHLEVFLRFYCFRATNFTLNFVVCIRIWILCIMRKLFW